MISCVVAVLYFSYNYFMNSLIKERILVHCCCGPCSTSSVQRLLDEGYEPVLCYGNSNIWSREENDKRYNELLKVAQYFNQKQIAQGMSEIEVVRLDYNHEEWLNFISGFENEPEHGERCLKCFEFNLKQAFDTAKKLGIDKFTTTLTVSRFKKSLSIFNVGEIFEGFQKIDFKKQDGFAKSVRMSKELGLYRQLYCGCEFSLQNITQNITQSIAQNITQNIAQSITQNKNTEVAGGIDNAKCRAN